MIPLKVKKIYIAMTNAVNMYEETTYLTEHSLFRTDETPTEGILFAISVRYRQTDVEYLAVILHVRIITINFIIAREVISDVRAYRCRIAGQGQCRRHFGVLRRQWLRCGTLQLGIIFTYHNGHISLKVDKLQTYYFFLLKKELMRQWQRKGRPH